MSFVGEYSGIGKVYTAHDASAQLSFAKLATVKPTAVSDFHALIASWLAGNNTTAYAVFPSDIARAVSREIIESLERRGIGCVRFNKSLPLGGYGLDAFASALSTIAPPPVSADDLFVFHNCFFGKFALASVPACAVTPDTVEKAGFADIDTTAQVIAVCRRTDKKTWEWSQSHVFPDGLHIQPALTAAEQYAQSCFEGMVASVNSDGEVFLFRPDRNAARFAGSCEALAIPPMDIAQFVDSVKLAVLANSQFLPRAGSTSKLYIRPYAKGLDGGYGVGPADSYLFAIAVFPYGDYFSGALDIIGIPGTRRSHEGGFGAVKASGNYGQTIMTRVKAKSGLLSDDGKIFHDTFYFGERKQQISIDGVVRTVVDDIIDEDSAGNILFLKSDHSGTTLFTPPLTRGAVLPGVTRNSLLTLAGHAGITVVEKELTWADIAGMDAGFVSGTAAGMVRIASMTYGGKKIAFTLAAEGNPQTPSQQAFAKLYDLLFAARRGDLRNVAEHGIKDWAVALGKSGQ